MIDKKSVISYKMIDFNNLRELNTNTLSQIHSILTEEANWNDSFSEFKKNYTKRNFKNTKLFLIYSDKKVAGFIEGWVLNKTNFYCKSFYVSSKYRSLNLGTKLKLRVFNHLKSLGFKKFIDGFVVNDIVTKISKKIIARKKELVNKNLKSKYSFALNKKNDILIKNRKRKTP